MSSKENRASFASLLFSVNWCHNCPIVFPLSRYYFFPDCFETMKAILDHLKKVPRHLWATLLSMLRKKSSLFCLSCCKLWLLNHRFFAFTKWFFVFCCTETHDDVVFFINVYTQGTLNDWVSSLLARVMKSEQLSKDQAKY